MFPDILSLSNTSVGVSLLKVIGITSGYVSGSIATTVTVVLVSDALFKRTISKGMIKAGVASLIKLPPLSFVRFSAKYLERLVSDTTVKSELTYDLITSSMPVTTPV